MNEQRQGEKQKQEQKIVKEIEVARWQVESAICRLVKAYGTPYMDEQEYYSNEFGITPYSGDYIDVVYDFFGGQGCAYIHNLSLATEKTEEEMEYMLILQLYLVVSVDGSEELYYHAHYNEGTEYDAATCDVIHASISTLSLEELCLVLQTIGQQEGLTF